jgi:ferredoxin-thioredoxin reductase catalytic subunit
MNHQSIVQRVFHGLLNKQRKYGSETCSIFKGVYPGQLEAKLRACFIRRPDEQVGRQRVKERR